MHCNDLVVYNVSVPGAVPSQGGGDASEQRGRGRLRESRASVCRRKCVPEKRRRCADGGNKPAAGTPSPPPVHRHQGSRLIGSLWLKEARMTQTVVTVREWGKDESPSSRDIYHCQFLGLYTFQYFNQIIIIFLYIFSLSFYKANRLKKHFYCINIDNFDFMSSVCLYIYFYILHFSSRKPYKTWRKTDSGAH